MNSVDVVGGDRADDAGIRRFLLVPLGWAVLLVVLTAALPASALPTVFLCNKVATRFVLMFGCIYGARAFERGDYLHGAWLYFGASGATLLVRDTAFLVFHLDARVAMTAIANAFQVLSAWRFGRAWKMAELPEQPHHLRTYVAVGVLVIIIGVGSLFIDVRESLGGNHLAMVGAASQMGDLASLLLIAPVLPTALALRGGSLAWPWALMAFCMVSWIAYDAYAALASVVTFGAVTQGLITDIFRAVANVLPLGSAIAQRRVSAAR